MYSKLLYLLIAAVYSTPTPRSCDDESGEGKGKVSESDCEQSKWTGSIIDEWFAESLDEKTNKPEDSVTTTTIEPIQGLFTPMPYLIELFGGKRTPASTTAAPTTNGSFEKRNETEIEGIKKDDKEVETAGHGSHGDNPILRYPRPVDIWDRLLMLAAFPICCLAVMLKAEGMLR